MNKNKFLYVAALFGMMVLVSCSSHDSAKNVTVTSEQGGKAEQNRKLHRTLSPNR